ncbi:class I SAM-dependent methyltransferase [Dyadobacter sp. CY347]|uniref:class I SAM-dependent DNA methyltransferase n=1 Tax=Dyadobacter sp. CY347 TaxID=2909336 RepID=UPI001F319E5A|nr:SAM-dependent methyltransferase [Dyadobacter sp. CY347]MCF2489193.1 nodulation S family protein [Dyadobacter sp. CY347]
MSDQKQTLPEDYFNDVYRNSNDPWNFETSEYELNKYKTTIQALTKAHYHNAFEIGCSIGVLTEMLAPKCDALLSVDAAEAPLVKARARLEGSKHVQIEKMAVPEQFPDQQFDLILMSEVGYYFAMPDLEKLMEKILAHLEKGGQLLLVHWTPEVHDYPLTGDQVHELFLAASGQSKPLKHVHSHREENYRLDSFEKQ